jgi:hypothetical protein
MQNKNICSCKKELPLLTVKKEGTNKGKEFYSCRECNYFSWKNSCDSYNPNKFKQGSCYRCGRWGCDAIDCQQKRGYYGNDIPKNWGDLI